MERMGRASPTDPQWAVPPESELSTPIGAPKLKQKPAEEVRNWLGPAPRGVGGVGVHPGVMIAPGESPGAAARACLTRPPRGTTREA